MEGFAKECAVVTHYRLKNDPNGEGVVVDPDARKKNHCASHVETIIWNTYKAGSRATATWSRREPVGQRGALGNAHAPVLAHGGIPLARRPHGPRHEGRGR